MTRGRRWPLMIDPQGQANKWIKEMEGKRLKVTDLKAKDFIRELENAIVYGMPYLLQDVEEVRDKHDILWHRVVPSRLPGLCSRYQVYVHGSCLVLFADILSWVVVRSLTLHWSRC